ncbi:hypothetical protein WA026_003556 [Henosepilachna vigintioctopunctata]|uniref:Uncharacterized protein n=1 Tax=Henosepilachna vigintioctopunctata TaxID=420089 RepID=A0AAW1TNB8_9CUCU
MVVKVYISGISGNKEVKKRQQRVLLILDSKNIKYDVIDIAEPGSEEQKDFMQNKSTSLGATISDPTPRHPLPPQIFNNEDYCGDYDQFDMANEIDEMEKFLKLETVETSKAEVILENGDLQKQAGTEQIENDQPNETVANSVLNGEDKEIVENEIVNEADSVQES